jgi:DNA repair exonuclease SbcCD nuclease subunit
LRVPTIVTVGNHDALAPPSIYHRISLLDAGSHVHFLDDPVGGYAVLEELGLTVWARAMIEHERDHNPLAGYRPLNPTHWQVVLAHGFFFRTGQPVERSSPIREDEIRALGCDYLALGHWHRFADVSVNGVPAFYPGSPSERGGTFASANLVTLDPETGVVVERSPLQV